PAHSWAACFIACNSMRHSFYAEALKSATFRFHDILRMKNTFYSRHACESKLWYTAVYLKRG
ncbi:MAG: hypothetical protein PV344_03465, partial [Anaplasma sp.]|nr:hypothetical protein [Anaplasma sp.]